MVNDYQIFKSKIGDFIPETICHRQTSLLDQSTIVTFSIQEKLSGVLVKDIHDEVPQLSEVANSVREICEYVFKAPPDFHPGNLILSNTGQLFFFDTGTPSDWEYFLDAEKIADVIGVDLSEAFQLTEFMKPIHEKHWRKLIKFTER
jgi:hypothetical protein